MKRVLIAFIVLSCFLFSGAEPVFSQSIQYLVHIANKGWTNNWAKDGEPVGASNLRMEAIRIKLDKVPKGSVKYSAHVRNIGWQDYVTDGNIAGTTGRNLRMEAIKIELVNSTGWSVKYKVRTAAGGDWSPEVADGAVAGTTGQDATIFEIAIRLEKRSARAANVMNIKYQVHVKDKNWMDWVTDGQVAGGGTGSKAVDRNYLAEFLLTGFVLPPKKASELKRVEAIRINLVNAPENAKVKYKVHVQNIGWDKNWIFGDNAAGTTGRSLQMEAIQIMLEKCPGYSVKYRVYALGTGWSEWMKNGAIAGTVGQKRPLYAIQIMAEKQ